jgi:cobalt/nickel transport system permease protein
MHMADALISPAVGGVMWAASAGLIGYCSKKVRKTLDDRRIPLMGVLGAFIFAAQMINFSIPGTGSSGHLGGGMILAILLGSHAGFLTMASVLMVQALFFADGGLLALGCNIFNLGFFPCFIACPLIYRKLAGDSPGVVRISASAMAACVISLQLGAFFVVLQTFLSGRSELPFGTFLLLMQPIHLAIGVVEGFATAAVVTFVWKARPETIHRAPAGEDRPPVSRRTVLAVLLVAALIGGVGSWFASTRPDGLEWAMFKTSDGRELPVPEGGIHSSLAGLQEKTSLLPGYGFRSRIGAASDEAEAAWPAVDTGTTVSGLAGGVLTLASITLAAFVLRYWRRVAAARHNPGGTQ